MTANEAPVVYAAAFGNEIVTVGTREIWRSEDGATLNVRLPGLTSRVSVVCFYVGNCVCMVDWSAIRFVALIDKLGGNSGGREVVVEYDAVARHHWVDVTTL